MCPYTNLLNKAFWQCDCKALRQVQPNRRDYWIQRALPLACQYTRDYKGFHLLLCRQFSLKTRHFWHVSNMWRSDCEHTARELTLANKLFRLQMTETMFALSDSQNNMHCTSWMANSADPDRIVHYMILIRGFHLITLLWMMIMNLCKIKVKQLKDIVKPTQHSISVTFSLYCVLSLVILNFMHTFLRWKKLIPTRLFIFSLCMV